MKLDIYMTMKPQQGPTTKRGTLRPEISAGEKATTIGSSAAHHLTSSNQEAIRFPPLTSKERSLASPTSRKPWSVAWTTMNLVNA